MSSSLIHVPSKLATTLLIVFLSSVFPFAVSAETITVSHAQGETSFNTPPRRVICFDLASLDTLNTLGVNVTGVPASQYPPTLEKYGGPDYVKVGSLFEPDLEAVNAMSADLIIVGGRSAPKFAELAKMAPTIDMSVDTGTFMTSTESNIRTLGRIFGKEKEAEEKIASLQKDIAALKAKTAGQGKGLLILTTGGKMSAYGPGSRFGILHDTYGMEPAVKTFDKGNGNSKSNHGQPISFEFIMKTNPDWLFVVDRDTAVGQEGDAAKRLLDNELVAKTTAWQKKQVVYLDAAGWYLIGGGLDALRRNVEQLSKAFDSAS